MIMALEATSKTNGECASPEAKRRACPGFDKKSDSLASKMMEMQMLSNPSMGLLIERKNKDKCEKLGCCYEKDEKAMMMQMMMNQNCKLLYYIYNRADLLPSNNANLTM